MRWVRKTNLGPILQTGFKREISTFLWFPRYVETVSFDSRKFTRLWKWLEHATWIEEYNSLTGNWKSIKWLDDNNYE